MTDKLASGVFRFDRCILDADRGTLQRSGELVTLRAKTFDLLCFLAANADRVVTKDELLAAVWPRVIVTEDSLTQAIRDVRRVIGDESQAILRTVARRGYLFALARSAPASAFLPPTAALPTTSREPSVAVLPFRNTGADLDDTFLIDGIVEEITNGLARFKTVAVIARNSAFALAHEAPPTPGAIADKLGVDYYVDGSARRAGGHLLVSVRLCDVSTGQQLWGENFDCIGSDVLDIQEIVARRIIQRLVSNIEASVLHRASARPAASIAAFEHLSRAIALLRGYGEGINERARAHLFQALELDPGNGLVHAYIALSELIIGGYGAAPQSVLLAARERAMTAIALTPEEARCHRILALVRLYMREHAAAETHLQRSLDLNPYDADTLAQMGYVLTMRGRPDEGLGWLERAIRLNPLHPPWYHFDVSMPLYALGRYGEAAQALESMPRRDAIAQMCLAAAYAMAGRSDLAARHLRHCQSLKPGLSLLAEAGGALEYEHRQDLDHLLRGIEAAIEAAKTPDD